MSEMVELEKRIDAIEKRLDSDIRRKKNSMLVSVVGGLILLVVVLIYFGFIKGLIREVLEPTGLMLMARDRIQKTIPDVSKEVEKTLTQKAPVLAAETRQKIVAAIPEGREYLESQLNFKVDQALDGIVVEFDKVVTSAITENKDDIVRLLKDIQDPTKKAELTEQVYVALEDQFNQPYIKADLESYTNVLIRLDKKINHLYDEKDLTEEEQIILDIIYSVREFAKRGAKIDVGKSLESRNALPQ